MSTTTTAATYEALQHHHTHPLEIEVQVDGATNFTGEERGRGSLEATFLSVLLLERDELGVHEVLGGRRWLGG